MRAVGYCRISKADRDKTEEQQRLSLRAQRASIVRACEERGWELVDVLEDFAKSGVDEERADYKRVQELLDEGAADVVVVTRLDRLSRTAWRLLYLIEEKGWNILAVEQSFDTREPEGWLAAAIHALMADYERRLLSKRTRQALAQRKREGVVPGRKSSVPVEVEDYIADMASDGMKPTAIARQLDAEGIATPGTSTSWHPKQVQRALDRVELRRVREQAAAALR